MKISELKHGMALELRDGTRCIVIAQNYNDRETGLSIQSVDYDLANKSDLTYASRYYEDMRHKEHRDLDIMKVWSNTIALFSYTQPRLFEREDFKVGDLVWLEGLVRQKLGVITQIDNADNEHPYRVLVQRDSETGETYTEWTNDIEKLNIKEEIYNG